MFLLIYMTVNIKTVIL